VAGPYRQQVAGEWAEASRLWVGLGCCPYEAALALFDAGGEAALRQALELFTGLGAAAAAQLTRRKMRALGIRAIPAGPRTATRADSLGLTRRQREVLELTQTLSIRHSQRTRLTYCARLGRATPKVADRPDRRLLAHWRGPSAGRRA
jgi:hypothetical protein